MYFSVITINYNNRDGLNLTIKSIVNQSYKDLEYIIIDGGSTDGSKEIISQYQERISFWVSEKDKGIYNAMNKGIAVAKGDYCIFMNSGDCFYNEHVLESVASRGQTEDIIVGNVVNEKGTIMSPQPLRDISLYHLYSAAIPHQGAFIRTHLLKKYRYDETLKISADWLFFLKTIILDNCSFTYIRDIIAVYDTMGISSTNLSLMRKEKDQKLLELFPPRILADYQLMKASECKTLSLTPLLRKNYSIDRLLYTIGKFLLKLKGAIR